MSFAWRDKLNAGQEWKARVPPDDTEWVNWRREDLTNIAISGDMNCTTVVTSGGRGDIELQIW